MSTSKRASSPTPSTAPAGKRVHLSTPPISVHSWLHPTAPPPLLAHSPPLHASSSTFLSFSIDFTPPVHVTSETSLLKEVRRVVRELNVPLLVGDLCMEANEGAFQDGEGRQAQSKGKGKERAREPDHRMWGVRAVVLKEGKDGTKGEGDYQLLEAFNDDGEKFGGERVLRIMRENQGVDVITVCCRWFGGDMLGPIRFQHIGITARTSLLALQTLVTLKDLRQTLVDLDSDIAGMRDTLKPLSSPLRGIDDGDTTQKAAISAYDAISDPAKLKRLITAREKTRASLEQKAAWVGMEQGRVEEVMAGGKVV